MDPLDFAPARPGLLLTEAALCAWFGRAAPGDRLVYYRGFLAIDVASDTPRLSLPERRELARVASRARLLAEQGLVHPFQQRHGPYDFTYMLIALPRSGRTDPPRLMRSGPIPCMGEQPVAAEAKQ